MPDKIDIVFTEDYAPKYGGGPTFKKGDQEEMAGDSARHYMNRGVAVTTQEYKEIQASEKEAEKAEKAAAKKQAKEKTE